jgi:hypothetical protein
MNDLIDIAYNFINNTLIPLAFSLCLLYFFWGIAQYIRAGAGSEKATEEGRNRMVYGVIALFVVFSIWGIIKFISSEFSLPSTGGNSLRIK